MGILQVDFEGIFDATFYSTGTPPLTRFFGLRKNRFKEKPYYRRSILVLKPQTGNMRAKSPLFH